MKTKVTLLFFLVVAASLICTVRFWLPRAGSTSAPVQSVPLNPELIACGAGVAAVGDCVSCHTTAGGQAFAGGLPIKSAFGTIFSANITPDVGTGIGLWSLKNFTRAMREGVSRDGHRLYPTFPYSNYTHMTDTDIAALYAFLMSRTPVRAATPLDQPVWPFQYRRLLGFWNLLFLHRGPVGKDPTQSIEWNRGHYLIEAAGHCEGCHTPLNFLDAEKASEAFNGGIVDGWEAPALNARSRAPVRWSKEQLTAYLSTSFASEHGASAGSMLLVTQTLAYARREDVEAMSTYLVWLETQGGGNHVSHGDSSTLARIRRGESLFSASCASCHDPESPMNQLGGRPLLTLSTAVNADSPRNIINLILAGISQAAVASPPHYMPPFASTLTDSQIADVVAYVRTRFTQKPAWPKLDDAVAKVRKESNPT